MNFGKEMFEKRKTPEDLIKALIGDEIKQKLQKLVETYLEKRRKLCFIEDWSDHLKELLIIQDDAFYSCKEYLSAWTEMCEYVIEIKDEGKSIPVSQILKGFAQLDMKVTKDKDAITSCILSPLHPYVLNSYLRAAEYARSNFGKENLGEKIDWLLDKIVPMYRTIILERTNTLFHSSKSIWPEFQSFSHIFSKPVNTPGGLVKIIKSYIGFHPYSKNNLSILLIDPPEGNGVGSAIKNISTEVNNLSIYQYNTQSQFILENHLSPAENYDLRTIPHNTNFDDWIKRSHQKFNIIFNFNYSKKPQINNQRTGQGICLYIAAGTWKILCWSHHQPRTEAWATFLRDWCSLDEEIQAA